ncbi:MAG: ABC transporter permease [Polyangiaceae bacterium]|nr:ABC transporter permease [Polyangiaceae bacterium]
MGFSLELALRYMRSRRRAFVSVGTMFAILGVALGVAALATVMSVTGGFRTEFRQKVLGVNAHVLILKYSSDFREYRKVMKSVRTIPGITGVAPFVINPMMVTHKQRTVTGVLVKGVDPNLMGQVLDLPRHIVECLHPTATGCNGSVEGLRVEGAKPPERRRSKVLSSPTKTSDKDELQPKQPFLDQLKSVIDDEGKNGAGGGVAEAAASTGSGKRAAKEPKTEDTEELSLPDTADGSESAVPEGGYESVLPDEDLLPPELVTDPCSDPKKVASMPGIVIGSALRRNLGVNVGGCVQVTSPTIGFSYSRGAMRAPVARQFRVVAVFNAGFDQYDSKLVYTDLFEAQNFYDTGDSVTGIEMKVSDIDHAKDVAQLIDAKLANGIYHTMDWEELNHGLFTALRIQQILMSLVLALIIVVAAFTVIATLIMVVLDKKKEIAVLKAMGASNSMLLRGFLYQGAIIGVIGTAIGISAGFFVCRGLLIYGFPLDPKVYFISKLPVQIEPWDFAMVSVFAILVCVMATLWPAVYAARLRPADAFRG